jgi:hypothetical protein
LAAAYAENGQFDQAILWQKKACALQKAQYPDRLTHLQELNDRLALYEKHQPYRESQLTR